MSGDMSRQSGNNGLLPDNVPEQEEDEFGEFEGFEGVPAEPAQAQAVPSPWATFPDLLPVQTSSNPASAEESVQNVPGRSPENRCSESWPDAVVAPVHRVPEEGATGGTSPIFMPSARSTNPPDVSLGARSSTANLDASAEGAAAGEPMMAASADPRPELPMPVPWQQQYLQADEQRENLQQQVLLLQQDNQVLQQQLAQCQAQLQALQLQLAQQTADQAESRRADQHMSTVCQKLEELQGNVSDLHKSCHTYVDKKEFESNLDSLRTSVESQVSELSRHAEQQNAALEARLLSRFTEEMHTFQSALESILDRQVQVLADRISDASSAASGTNAPNQTDRTVDSILTSVRGELKRHAQEQEKMLERERKQQLLTLSQVLKAACNCLGSLADNETAERNNVNDKSEKS